MRGWGVPIRTTGEKAEYSVYSVVLTHVEAITSGATSTVHITRVGMFATPLGKKIKGLFPGFFSIHGIYYFSICRLAQKSAPPFLAI